MVIKSNEVLIHGMTWMSIENTKICERSQTQKTTNCMIPFTGKKDRTTYTQKD